MTASAKRATEVTDAVVDPPDTPSTTSDEKLLTYDQVATEFSIPRGTLFYWVARQVIPFIRLGPRTVRFRRADLRRWLESRTVQTTPTDEVAR